MTINTRGAAGSQDPFPEDEIESFHSPEPWRQNGRYIRDARGAIVVRGRTAADARRITAAINATRDIPTEALENWLVQDVSDPVTRPDLEVALEEPEPSPFAVPPPDEAPVSVRVETPAREAWPYTLTHPERREGDRRESERRRPDSAPAPDQLLFDRRVMERRFGERRSK
ncbi:MAG TPA: hypothetical protein VMN82_07110 [Thermoanaerobaculia bacterium]|nr:hypothetical protein [Thermoanaerobaculia bacterium]